MDICGIEDIMANNVLVQAKNDTAVCKKWRKNFKLPDFAVCEETIRKINEEIKQITPESLQSNKKMAEHFEFIQLCEKQPIGKEMFGQFCKSSEAPIKNTYSLWQAICDFEISPDSERLEAANMIVNSYLAPNAPYEAQSISEHLKVACTTLVSKESPPTLEETQEIMKSAKAITSPEKSAERSDKHNLSVSAIAKCHQPDVILTHLSDEKRRFHFIKLLFDYCKNEIYPFFVDEVFQVYKKSKYFETFVRWKYKEKEPVIEDDFFQLRLLGKGGFGEVYAYQVKTSGKLYACKKTCKKKMKQKHAEKVVISEKQTLEMVNSPFVVSLAYAYENKSQLNLVMTLMGSGDLKFHIYETKDKKRGLSPERTKFYAAQITLGMDHLHKEDILYRDLKPENVLLDDKGNVRIADLGLVCFLKDTEKTSGKAGTVGYMAPEMLNHEKYAFGVDWFALGCTIFEMIEGKGPFVMKGANKRRVCAEATINKTLQEKQTYKRDHRSELVDLIDRLLVKNVDNRLAGEERSAEPIKRHPYFADMNWERLEAGLIEVPFTPNPNQVYAKDVSEIRLGSEAKGVDLTDADKEFHKRFASGRVPIPWQQEMIETGLFEEVMNRKEGEDNASRSGKKGSKSSVCSIL